MMKLSKYEKETIILFNEGAVPVGERCGRGERDLCDGQIKAVDPLGSAVQ